MMYKVIGLMSGTSLDGLDLAYVEFTETDRVWSFELKQAKTSRYSDEWFVDLRNSQNLPESQLNLLHSDYGVFLGHSVKSFIEEHNLSPDFIASHGHTVFHQPEKGITYQLGDGQALANTCQLKTVSDFRSLDVSLGGQGAPLVPIGDKFLFNQYDVCLNLGGFANLSFELEGKRIAFDVSPVNIAMNVMANALGKEYDDNGGIAATGSLIPELLHELTTLAYYEEDAPKSLSREWLDEQFMPILRASSASNEDKLHTLCIHIAQQVKSSIIHLHQKEDARMLVTGGGAHNGFLVDCIRNETGLNIHVPDRNIIEYKEALIFAFLGVLRTRGDINCLSSVTGASRDSSCGVITYH